MGQEGCHGSTTEVLSRVHKYKCEAVAMFDAPEVTVNQIASDLGIGANALGWWRGEVRQVPKQAFVGNGRSHDDEVSQLHRELARVRKERDCLREAAAFLARASQ